MNDDDGIVAVKQANPEIISKLYVDAQNRLLVSGL